MKFNVNWTKGKLGNEAKEGQKIYITCEQGNAGNGKPKHILFGVYQKGFPVIIGQKDGGKIDFKLARKGLSLKGKATLKVTCYDEQWRSFGWKDDFNIV